jgi:4-aminobutyrate aminotransferase
VDEGGNRKESAMSSETHSRSQELLDVEQRYFAPVVARSSSVVIDHGRGSYMWSVEGKRYLDFAMGIATVNTGHCHPTVVEAARTQMEKLVHPAATVAHYEANIRLVEKLATITPGDLDMTFLTNSGAEAVDSAIKLARYVTGRTIIIAFQGGFHGRTYGALTLTSSKVHYREGYEPFVPSTYIMPFPYSLRCQLGHDCRGGCVGACVEFVERQFKHVVDPHAVAAMVVEPVQGEGGYVVPPAWYLGRLREICDRYGILLVADEVQSGFGRTGKWFASEHFDVVPDVQIMAKGIASGFPLAAISARRTLMEQWRTAAHGSTFGGNPVSCAAAMATIDAIRDEGMLDNAARQGETIRARLRALQAEAPRIAEVRGLGLMIAVEFSRPDGSPDGALCEAVRTRCIENGLLLLSCGYEDQVLRLMPALNVSDAEVDEGLRIFEEAVRYYSRQPSAISHQPPAGG